MSRRDDGNIHHTLVVAHFFRHILGKAIQSFIIVTRNLYAVCTVLQVERVAESTFAHSRSSPISSTYRNDFSYDLVLQGIWESRVSCFVVKLNHDSGSLPANGSLIAFYPVELGKESLNLHYLVVQFMHTPAQRHLSTDIQFHLLFLWHKRVGVKGIDKKFERTCKQYCEHQ